MKFWKIVIDENLDTHLEIGAELHFLEALRMLKTLFQHGLGVEVKALRMAKFFFGKGA